MLKKMKDLVLKEEGQGLSEYGILLAAVVAIVGVAVIMLRDQIKTLFTDIVAKVTI